MSTQAPPTWSSNTTLPELAAWLRTKRRIVILTHVKPDGDAVGSTLAVARALNLATRTGQNYIPAAATPWYWGPTPDWFRLVVGPTEHRLIDEVNRADRDDREDPDAVLILDTGSWSQLHEVREWLHDRRDIAAILDHHRHGDPDVAERRIVLPSAAAACEPAAELCRLLLNLPDISGLPPEVAEPLYMGIATDTGWFRHSSVTPATLRTAASLLEAGVNAPALYQLLEQQDRPSRLRLLARALSSLEFHKNDSVAIMTLTLQDFHDSHSPSTDSGGFTDIVMKAAPVRVAAVITEAYVHDAGNITKISLRSKDGENAVDVDEVARKLGGGGHIRASGAKVPFAIAEAKRRLLEALQ